MIPTSTPARTFVLLALVATLALAACGREASDETSSTKTESTTTTEAETALEPPEAKESIEDAITRLEKAIGSKDCDEMNEFNLTSRPVEDEEARCETLTTLFGGKVLDSEEFPGGAIVDYEYGEYGITGVFVVEADGRFHLAHADNLLDGKSVGTPPADEFDEASESAFAALSERDCESFLKVANPRHGRASAGEEAACAFVESNPVPTLIEEFPELTPELLGANSDYALYAVSTPEAAMVMVLGRAEDPADGLSSTYEPLPKKAPEYGFVDLVATDPADPPEG